VPLHQLSLLPLGSLRGRQGCGRQLCIRLAPGQLRARQVLLRHQPGGLVGQPQCLGVARLGFDGPGTGPLQRQPCDRGIELEQRRSTLHAIAGVHAKPCHQPVHPRRQARAALGRQRAREADLLRHLRGSRRHHDDGSRLLRGRRRREAAGRQDRRQGGCHGLEHPRNPWAPDWASACFERV